MTWSSTAPNGNVSVKQNRPILGGNTTYIENTMGNTANDLPYDVAQKDHFWDQGGDLDGHHRFVKMPGFTDGGTPTDPGSPLGTSIDGMIYLKEASSAIGRVEGFYRNIEGIYQFIPSFKEGTKSITSSSSYISLVDVPANVYGEIFMYTSAIGSKSVSTGFFRSDSTVVEAWAVARLDQGSGTASNPLKFGNGSEVGSMGDELKIQVRRNGAASATWSYKITYRAI